MQSNRRGFYYCSNLKRINVSNIDSLFKIGFNQGSNDVGPLINGADLYCNGKLVTEVKIPAGTTEVVYILQGCTSIEKITVPSSVQRFSSYAFCNMPSLKEVIFEDPGKITDVSFGVFQNCTSLVSVDFSGFTSLKTMDATFSGCTSLVEVKLPAGLTELGSETHF